MCASDGDAHLIFHQPAEKVGAFVNRDPRTLGGPDLGVVFGDRGGTHNPIHSSQVARVMPNVYMRTGLADFLGKGSQGAVRAAHRVSALQKEAGDGGKTASPDADEMDVCHYYLSAFSNQRL